MAGLVDVSAMVLVGPPLFCSPSGIQTDVAGRCDDILRCR